MSGRRVGSGFDAHRLTEEGRRVYKRRKETIERSFADGKELHGQRYVRMRGLLRAQEQCLLAAACQNMKKIALLLNRKAEKALDEGLRTAFDLFKKVFRGPFRADNALQAECL